MWLYRCLMWNTRKYNFQLHGYPWQCQDPCMIAELTWYVTNGANILFFKSYCPMTMPLLHSCTVTMNQNISPCTDTHSPNKLMLRYGSSRQYVPTNKAEMPWPQQRENLRLCLAVNQKILNLDNRNMLLNTSQCFTEPKPFCVFLSHSLYTPKIAQPFN